MIKNIAIFCLFLLASCGGSESKQTTQETVVNSDSTSWKKLETNTYSIQYPPKWEVNTSGESGTSFFLYLPAKYSEAHLRENVNLLIQNLSGLNIDLDKFVEISEKQIKGMTVVPNSVLIESKRIKNNSDEYQCVIFESKKGMLHFKCVQYYWVLNEKAYILTFTCEQSRFSKDKATAERIMNSFKLNK